MRTSAEYKASLKAMRPNVYKFGELIEDVTSHPSTRRMIEGHGQLYDLSFDPKWQDVFTTMSILDGKRVSRYLNVVRSVDDMVANCRMKRAAFNLTGTCTGARCVGFTAMNAMWAATYDMDKENGTEYHKRLRAWLAKAQKDDITVAGALTDAKGDRSLSASQQEDPDMSVHIVERRKDGIVVRGAKVMICGTAAANEVFVLPGAGYKENEKDYAVSFVIPRDTKGMTIVETRKPNDTRCAEGGFDDPVAIGGITQAYIFFEDVFVPNDRVFMSGEWKHTVPVIMNFTSAYRAAIGACVAGQGDVMVGASVLMARANGLDEKVFRDKLTKMVVNNETTFAMGLAAAMLGKAHPSGAWISDPLLANINKVHVGSLPYDTKILAQEIGGGICETGCMPSYVDFNDKRYGHLVRKYLKANATPEDRAKAARLVEWLTIGGGVPGCMHGGGSPDGAKLLIWTKSEIEKKVDMAKRLADVKGDIRPKPKDGEKGREKGKETEKDNAQK